ncbi:hypothetical protein ACFFLS_06170 [Flavobacterium procerum]|uniref:Uncharacterized protein n=1 Tax=Flavobacterium procerum TaxID=1455569 RepID=A0ABV6BME3_9FLAO
MKRKFNKNKLVTYVLNDHNKTIRIRYYKSMIAMYFETGIVYKYIFKNNNCLEYKYINGTLIGCTVWENKNRQSLIQDIQDSHAGKPPAPTPPIYVVGSDASQPKLGNNQTFAYVVSSGVTESKPAEPTRQEKQKTFFTAITSFFNSI